MILILKPALNRVSLSIFVKNSAMIDWSEFEKVEFRTGTILRSDNLRRPENRLTN